MRFLHLMIIAAIAASGSVTQGQTYGPPDRDKPGDEMIQEYMARLTQEVHGRFKQDVASPDYWTDSRRRYKEEYFYMLGLGSMPEKTPLKPTVTGTMTGDGFVVDMLHYQSRPGLYVTANLYRPTKIPKGDRLPAVLYVCGHSNRGRNGNKTAYQSHGMWFARHGYICLVLDSLQLGEIAAIHHGTYRERRWWWHSRGYTSAGVECLNGIRGIDYLTKRPDVDPQRIAVTGISGGGAATFWIAAADDRVKVAVPVSGMADLMSYIPNRVINGHCDCMFLYNTFQWPWTRIAALVAPRPLLFVNSDKDAIFPMDANERVINRLERIYSLYGAGDFVGSVVSIGGHAYRKDIRQAAYRFINMHLKNDPGVVTDSEVDLVTGSGRDVQHPIKLEKLRVFPQDSDIPADELNTTIDRHFVPVAKVQPPHKGEYPAWKKAILAELRRVAFRGFPEQIPAATLLERVGPGEILLASEPGIKISLRSVSAQKSKEKIARILLIVQNPSETEDASGLIKKLSRPGDLVFTVAARGVGKTQWTQKNPPNFVERSHALLGRTVDAGRVRDIAAAACYLRNEHGKDIPICVSGEGIGGVLAAYAALWESDITEVIVNKPPLSHMNDDAPQFLNVLRVCDIGDVLGMIAPRKLTAYGGNSDLLKKVAEIYDAAGASAKFVWKRE